MTPYAVEPPDVLSVTVFDKSPGTAPLISGNYLVGPDGTVNLGAWGQVFVSGKTLEQVQDEIKRSASIHVDSPQVLVDVFAYRSQVYYVITRDGQAEDRIVRLPITGNETVLDAIAQVGGLKSPDSTLIWIARPPRNGIGAEKMLPLDWDKVTRGGSSTTNYQLLPATG